MQPGASRPERVDDEEFQGAGILACGASGVDEGGSRSKVATRAFAEEGLGDPALLAFGALLTWGAVALVRASGRGAADEAGKTVQEFDAGMPAELSSSLSEIREHRLRVGAPAWRSQRLVIGKGRQVWLGKGDYLALALPGFGAQTQPVEGRARLAAGRLDRDRDGTANTAARSGGKGGDTVRAHAFLSRERALAGASGFEEVLGAPAATRTLVRYELALGEHLLLPNEGLRELPENAGEAFTTLRDGSWIYAAGDGLEVRLPEGKARRFALDQRRCPGGCCRGHASTRCGRSVRAVG